VAPERASRLQRLRGLYAIADDGFAETPARLLSLVEAFLRGGAQALQLRCKRLGSGEFLALARASAARCRQAGALLFINDRPDLAALAGADGVHLGQQDLPLREARALVGPGVLLGVSTHGEAELERAVADGADCVGFGPIFATDTKRATTPASTPLPPPRGIVGMQQIAARAPGMPLIAIGGIDEPQAEALAAAGALCVAVIAALCRAEDPETKARALVRAFARGQARREAVAHGDAQAASARGEP